MDRWASASVSYHPDLAVDVNLAVPASVSLVLFGLVARESALIPGTSVFNIIRGAIGGGTVVVPGKVGIGEVRDSWYGPTGVGCADGISVDMVSGEVDLAIYYGIV